MKFIKKIISFIKKIISFEPLIIWVRYFLTVNIKSLIANFIIPLIVCIILGIYSKDTIINAEFDVFTISSILVGFCSSILIMLFTIEGKNIERLKATTLKKSKVTLYQALIYKFSFITINLVILIFVGILARYINFEDSLYFKLYTIFILQSTIFILIEALTNVVFSFINAKGDESTKK